ncbi:MAG TPA: VanW family protein [Acidimicrobiales bacterium]
MRRRARHAERTRWLRSRWALAPLGLALVLVAAAVIDNVAHRGEVLRNVSLAGVSVGGQSEPELRTTLADLEPRFAEIPVELVHDEQVVSTTAGRAGLRIDVEATIDATLDTGRDGLLSPLSWIGGLFRDRKAPLRMQLDDAAFNATLEAFETEGDDPVRFEVRDGAIVAEGGTGGQVVERDAARVALMQAAARGDNPIRVEVTLTDAPPELSRQELLDLAAKANAATAGGIDVTVAGQVRRIEPEMLRSWLRPDVENRSFTVDTAAAVADLGPLLPEVASEGSDAQFVVENDVPVIVGGDPATACCADDTGARILDALQSGRRDAQLALRETPRPRGRQWAESLGIKELVGEFTTRYQPGQPRVINIKRISELTRGVVIEPGQTFSINEFVGRRTVENGFVAAGSIQNGVFEDSVGGGISQYATTLFNAAFFAGLDFAEYQSHSIYISRYPYGREATVSYPKPDLKITNSTPYGVLLWPIATDNSITVKLFSTKWVTGEQTNQTSRKSGVACTRVVTERTRTYVDGRPPVVDEVVALYRPEGINCAGNPTVPTTAPPPPPSEAPSSTAVPPSTEATTPP